VNSTTVCWNASGTLSDEPARPSPWRRSYPGGGHSEARCTRQNIVRTRLAQQRWNSMLPMWLFRQRRRIVHSAESLNGKTCGEIQSDLFGRTGHGRNADGPGARPGDTQAGAESRPTGTYSGWKESRPSIHQTETWCFRYHWAVTPNRGGVRGFRTQATTTLALLRL